MKNDVLAASTDLRRVSLFALRPHSEQLVKTFLAQAANYTLPEKFDKTLMNLSSNWSKIDKDQTQRKIWAEEILTLAAQLYHLGLKSKT